MKFEIFVFSIFFSCVSLAAEFMEIKYIDSGKKEVISCPERNTHLFCNVSETFDTPGMCGHGFDCVLMKSGDKQTVCKVTFECKK